MHHASPVRILRIALAIDALSCLGMGAVLAAGADALAGPLGLPTTLLRAAGLVLLPCAAVLGALASRSLAASGFVWAAVVLNVGWVVESLALLAGHSIQPTALGSAFILVQAMAVLALAIVEGLANHAARRDGLGAGAAF